MLSALRPGDTVDVIAPASKCTPDELRNGLRAIKELGLVPRVPKNLFGPSKLFSNTDKHRLEQLHKALYASDSKMIWCVRGGYGGLRLIPDLMKWSKPKHKKIFLGYSDITSLHLHLNQQWGWATLHGQMVERFGGLKMTPKERRHLVDVLFGKSEDVDYGPLKPLNTAAKTKRTIRGEVTGGNLAVLMSSFGTKSQYKPNKDIVFLEDIGERPHRVDRMLEQMKQAGTFKNAKAIVFGYFMLDQENDRKDLWNDVIPRFAETMKIPILKGLPVGHNWERQSPLPFNTKAELQTGERGRLNVSTGIRAK